MNNQIIEEPVEVPLKLLFYEYGGKPKLTDKSKYDATTAFELNAGLIAALSEFARLLKRPMTGLLFNYMGEGELPDNWKPVNVEGEKHSENEIGTIITVRCDVYNHYLEVKKKVDLIYEKYVKDFTPFGSGGMMDEETITNIIRVLSDEPAKEKLAKHSEVIRDTSLNFLEDMNSYGLESIMITSCDFTPLATFGDLSLIEGENLLRNLGDVPLVDTYSWKYRESRFVRSKVEIRVWNYIVNSGAGITLEGQFQPFYYMLMCTPGSFLGEVPQQYYTLINNILLED
ncbi:MAG: hypothetical protein RBG13Loki_2391 [Promethearchaeota archaeon CR_4]|nr:MAG: hypothetical protein RBG13Loki_2391 [Candidatus Lokiarchaeota archaeon CR_4]